VVPLNGILLVLQLLMAQLHMARLVEMHGPEVVDRR
jgi:hypothetical protein